MRDAGPVFRVSRDSLTLELERFLSTDRRSVPCPCVPTGTRLGPIEI